MTRDIGKFGMGSLVSKETTDQALDVDSQMDEHACELPSDVIFDILLRLPVKKLVTLKLVSKPWYFMISNKFIPEISPPSPLAKLSGFIFPTCNFSRPKVSEIEFIANRGNKDSGDSSSGFLSFLQDSEDIQDCCNGLLLVARGYCAPIQYLVHNPFTRECIPIPINPNRGHFDDYNLAFDPSNSLSYRIVNFSSSLCNATISSPPMVDIFWSETQTWSNHYIPVEPRVCGFRYVGRGIYFKRVLYRLSEVKFLICIDLSVGSSQEICLNLSASALELPDRDEDNACGAIGTSGGCLYYSKRVELDMLFWVLDDCSKWVLKHSINMVGLLEHPLFIDLRQKSLWVNHSELRFCAFHPYRNEILLGTLRLLFRYHLETRSLELIYETDTHEIEGHGHWFFPYARCPIVINSVLQRHKCTFEK